MLEILLRPAFLAPALLLAGYLLYELLRPARLPKLPIVGAREGDWFPLLQARWRNTLDYKRAVKEAHERYPNQACLLPEATSGNVVLLPASEIQFLIDQPDSVLDMHTQVIESLQTDHTVTDPRLVREPMHQKLITTTLTSQVGNLVPEVSDETTWAFAQHWGTDAGEWRELCVYDTMRHIIGNVTNRVFVGLPGCRDPALLDAGMAYAQDVPLTAQVLKVAPRLLRPAIAPLVTLPNRIHTNAFFRVIRPEIERRLAEWDARRADPEAAKSSAPERNDFLQWSIRQAKESGDPYTWQPRTLAGRVLLLNFAAIHTSSFAITNAVLDLVSSRPEYVEELRAEIAAVLADSGGRWDKRALARMEKLDSTLRESARLNSFVTVGLMRVVSAPGGVTTPSGVHIPRGTRVAVPGYAVLHDEAVYPRAAEFLPFRFAEKRKAAEGAGNGGGDYVKRARNAFAATSGEYIAFGHGRHACPGRFFAASELKLMLAHIVLNYDLEMQDARPPNKWLSLNRVPPIKATIRVRRRKAV